MSAAGFDARWDELCKRFHEPQTMRCRCGGHIDFTRSIGTMEGERDGEELVLANCDRCGTTRAKVQEARR